MNFVASFLAQHPTIAVFISKTLIFLAFEVVIFVVFVYAAVKEKDSPPLDRDENLRHFGLLIYSLLSASVVQVVSITPLVASFKLFVMITNLWALFYLAFFNSWFQHLTSEILLDMSKRGIFRDSVITTTSS